MLPTPSFFCSPFPKLHHSSGWDILSLSCDSSGQITNPGPVGHHPFGKSPTRNCCLSICNGDVAADNGRPGQAIPSAVGVILQAKRAKHTQEMSSMAGLEKVGMNTRLLLSIILSHSRQEMLPAPGSLAPGTAIKFSLQDLSAAIKTCFAQPVLLAEQPEIRQEDKLWVSCRNTCAKHTHCHRHIFPWCNTLKK